MLLELKQLRIQPGQQLLIEEVSWQQFEKILTELGERRTSRLSYSNGRLEIMVPLPDHEKAKEIISDIIKILLESRQVPFESLGSTTLRNERMTQAVEPDACFYIQNQALVIGKNRLDMTVDPPPDLVIEIDMTSRTQLDNYRLLGVPELWRYTPRGLQIQILEDGDYIESKDSRSFPDIPIIDLVAQFVRQSQVSGRTQAIGNFRTWVEENL